MLVSQLAVPRHVSAASQRRHFALLHGVFVYISLSLTEANNGQKGSQTEA